MPMEGVWFLLGLVIVAGFTLEAITGFGERLGDDAAAFTLRVLLRQSIGPPDASQPTYPTRQDYLFNS